MDELAFPVGSRVVAYLRDSGGRDQNLSVPQQEKAVGEWCRTNGFILSRIYRDEARSGTRIKGRDAFLEMVDYLGNKVPEKGVIFWELSRLSRDYNDCQYYLADLRRQGYIVHSLTDNIPPGLDGQMLESMKIWMNAKYIEDLKKNIRRGLRYITEEHHAKLGVIPMGYKGEPKQIGKRRGLKDNNEIPHIIKILVPDPDTAPLVRKAFGMRARGSTFLEIDKELHLFKVLWSYSYMLKNPIYIGIKNLGDEIIENYCEPIVDKQLFDAVQVINKQRMSHLGINHPRVNRSRFFLSGLIYCNACGKPMYANSTQPPGRPRYDYYLCTSHALKNCDARRIPKSEVERLVLDMVRIFILQPENLRDLYQIWQKQLNERKAESIAERKVTFDRISAEITKNKVQIANILKAIKDAGHSRSMLAELQVLEDRQKQLEGEIANLDMQPSVNKYANLDEIITTIGPSLNMATDQERGMILRGFINSIKVEKTNEKISGTIEYILPVNESEEIIIPVSIPLH